MNNQMKMGTFFFVSDLSVITQVKNQYIVIL